MATQVVDQKSMTVIEQDQRREYPIEFLELMHDYGAEALHSYLEQTKAPQEIKDIVEGQQLLLIEMLTFGRPRQDDGSFAELAIREIARGVKFTGGQFYAPDSAIPCE